MRNIINTISLVSVLFFGGCDPWGKETYHDNTIGYHEENGSNYVNEMGWIGFF